MKRSVDRKETGKRIRMLMEERKITIRQMSDEIGVTFGAVSNILNGRCLPTIDNMLIMADFMGVKLEDMTVLTKEEKERRLYGRH